MRCVVEALGLEGSSQRLRCPASPSSRAPSTALRCWQICTGELRVGRSVPRAQQLRNEHGRAALERHTPRPASCAPLGASAAPPRRRSVWNAMKKSSSPSWSRISDSGAVLLQREPNETEADGPWCPEGREDRAGSNNRPGAANESN